MTTIPNYPPAKRALLDGDLLLGSVDGKTVRIPAAMLSAFVRAALPEIDSALRDDLAGAGGVDLVNGAATVEAVAAKADHFPAAPHLPLATGYRRVLDGWYAKFFNVGANHIRPSDGSGNFANGLPDSAAAPSSWQSGVGLRTLYWERRIALLKGDAARAAEVKNQVQGDWTYYQTFYTPAQIKTGLGGIVNSSDDGSIHAQRLQYVHEITGDPNALAYLVEFVPYHNIRFHDPNQTAISYGVSTPGGTAFQSDPYGSIYFIPSGADNFNDIQDLCIADALLYVSQLPTSPTLTDAFKAACRQFAQNTWAWVHGYCRASVGNHGPIGRQPAPNLYFYSLDLNPGSATYLKGRFLGAGGDAPVRGQCAYGPGMSFMMIALSLRLYRVTGEAKYLTEAQAAVASCAAENGFLRYGPGGVPMIGNPRDPWVDGTYWPEYVFADFFEGAAPGVPTTGAVALPLAQAIYNSGLAVASAMVDGYSTPDWSGDEYCPATGKWRWTDEGGSGGQGGNPALDYGGQNGGGQGSPRQVMTGSATAGPAQAAVVLEQYLVTYGSGVAGNQAIEKVPARLSALELAVSHLMPRSGGNFTDQTGMDSEFYMDRNVNPYWNWHTGWFNYFDRTNLRFTWSAPGADVLQIGSTYLKSTMQTHFCAAATQGFYAGYGDGPYLNFDTGSYLGLSAARMRYELVLGQKLVLDVDGNGNMLVLGNIAPIADNVAALGGPSNRFTQVYAASGAINTSDETLKVIRGPMSDAELAAARDIAASMVIYQYKDAVAAKGEAARLHAGYAAQEVFETFVKHGLDPHRYGACCWDEWDADPGRPEIPATPGKAAVIEPGSISRDKPGGIVLEPAVLPTPYQPAIAPREAGSMYGLRLDELHAFIAAAQEQRLIALEAKAAT